MSGAATGNELDDLEALRGIADHIWEANHRAAIPAWRAIANLCDEVDRLRAERDALRAAMQDVQKALSVASVLPSLEPVRRIVAAALTTNGGKAT